MRIGTDLVHIPSLKEKLETPGFKERIFHPNEAKRDIESLAGIVAVKEAFFKAIGKPIDWLAIEITKEPSGRPRIEHQFDIICDCSISHDHEYAMATVVLT